MNELYWITVLGKISFVSVSIMIVLAIVWTVIIIGFIVTSNDSEYDYTETRGKLKSISKKLVLPTIIFLLLSIFIPSSRDLMAIYGVGGVIDYVQKNPDAKQLPDKYIKVLNKWADNELKNDSIK